MVAGKDSQVYLFNVATGKTVAAFGAPSAPGYALAYHPNGKQLAALGRDGKIHLWDLLKGRESVVLSGDGLPLYSPDGSRIASPGGSKCQLWNSSTGKEIAVLAEWQPNEAGIAFSPDGKLVAANSKTGARLCDAVTGRLLASLGADHNAPADRLRLSPDGRRIAGSIQGKFEVYLWDTATGKEVAAIPGHTAYIRDIRFSADGSRLLTASDYPENTARLWDAATGRPLKTLAGHKNSVGHAIFSPDGRRIATSSMDQTARLWDGSGEPIAVLGGHTGWVDHIRFSPNSTRLVTASTDATLRLWNARTGELIAVLRGHGGRLVLPAGLHIRRLSVSLEPPRMARGAARLGPGSGGAETFGSASGQHRDLCLRCGLQPRWRAGGILCLGRHDTPVGRHVRPSNRFVQARKEHRRQRDIQRRRPAAG